MKFAPQKNEIIQWVNSLTDETLINQILALKANKKFDFEKEWERGISGDELRKKSDEFIKSLSWEK